MDLSCSVKLLCKRLLYASYNATVFKVLSQYSKMNQTLKKEIKRELAKKQMKEKNREDVIK